MPNILDKVVDIVTPMQPTEKRFWINRDRNRDSYEDNAFRRIMRAEKDDAYLDSIEDANPNMSVKRRKNIDRRRLINSLMNYGYLPEREEVNEDWLKD